jgi:hypothetical protein
MLAVVQDQEQVAVSESAGEGFKGGLIGTGSNAEHVAHGPRHQSRIFDRAEIDEPGTVWESL